MPIMQAIASLLYPVYLVLTDRLFIDGWTNTKKINGGKEIIQNLKTRGRSSKITQSSSKKLVSIIKKPASKFGFETDLWNTKRIQVVCKKELKISVSHMAVWRFLKRINYSCKKVQKQYYEANKSKQKEWVKKTVPEIKRDC